MKEKPISPIFYLRGAKAEENRVRHQLLDSAGKKTVSAVYSKQKKTTTMKPCQAVVCEETGELFVSMSEAARRKGITRQKVQRALKTGWAAGGVHWCTADDWGKWTLRTLFMDCEPDRQELCTLSLSILDMLFIEIIIFQ
eukprot:g11624.t1